MRIDSNFSSNTLRANSDSSASTSRVSNNTRDTISKSEKEKEEEYTLALTNVAATICLFFAASCAFLFLIVDFIKQWVQMKR